MSSSYEHATRFLAPEAIERIEAAQRDEVERRIAVLRGGRPLPNIVGRTVILVDDGIAMGSTMRASIALCRQQDAGMIVVAVPVAGRSAIEEIGRLVDRIIVLESPANFRAVAQVYGRWYDVPDREVQEIMATWERLMFVANALLTILRHPFPSQDAGIITQQRVRSGDCVPGRAVFSQRDAPGLDGPAG